MNFIRTRVGCIAAIIVMITLYGVANLRVNSYRADYKYKLPVAALPVPPELMRAMAGEFKGLVADYLLLEAASFIGSTLFFDADPEDYFKKRKQMSVVELEIDEKEILRLVEERANARKEKNWALADDIRNRLSKMGIVLEDKPEGTIWKIEK